MSTQQQQQQPANPGIMPSLADLDTPPDKPADQDKPGDKPADNPADDLANNPTKTPSKDADKQDDKPADDKATDDEPADEPADDEPADPQSFWDEVTKLRGDDLKIEFPQDIDPLTPAGIHHALKVAEDHGAEIMEQSIQQNDPRAYAYMLHRASGGSDEEFFSTKTEVLPDTETLKGSVDLQQAFYKRSLTRKGILPEQADLIIKDAIDKGQLATLALNERQVQEEANKVQLEDLKRITQLNQQREQQHIQKMATTLQEKILENKGMPITIPDAKRASFLQFVNNLMVFDRTEQRWYMNSEVTSETLPNLLSAMYYLHVGGNLSDIIANKAAQQNTKQLRLKMASDKTKKSSQPDPNKTTNNKPGVQPAVSEL